jgi:hypothetical protein
MPPLVLGTNGQKPDHVRDLPRTSILVTINAGIELTF